MSDKPAKKVNLVSLHRAQHLRREERRTQAAERAEARAKRTLDEQFKLIASRPGNSAKERDRLGALL